MGELYMAHQHPIYGRHGIGRHGIFRIRLPLHDMRGGPHGGVPRNRHTRRFFMGEEISRTSFTPQDFKTFENHLREETDLLSKLVADEKLSKDGYVAGFEIEAWLLDHGFFPRPINEKFLDALDHSLVVPELSRFNVELNSPPLALTGDILNRAAAAFKTLWTHCNDVAHGLDTNMVMIGTLPVIRDEDLTLQNLSPLKRYKALNNEVLRRRGGKPLVVDIAGHDHLRSEHGDVMLEAATTSLQIHLKTPARLAHRYYNASIMASAPLLAACTNAPFLFKRALWQETRIPLFEQSVALKDNAGEHGRVTFGSGYVRESLFEVLIENLNTYPVLLPLAFDEPSAKLRHVHLHNGTIWRWNRPIVGFDSDGTPHIRIEHRTLPAGPTIVDMIANAACYFGIVRDMVDSGFDESMDLAFDDARANFYEAAREGLDAKLTWPGLGQISAKHLMQDHLLPAAHRGLKAFGVDAKDRELYLEIMETRVETGQTGAVWQRAALEKWNGDFREMMSAYCERQRSAIPVHQWDI